MRIKINNIEFVGHDYHGRKYQIFFDSKRDPNPEDGVEIRNYSLNWNFIDTRLGFPLNVELTERVFDGNADVTAKVRFKKSYSDYGKVDDYVKRQLEQIAADGMVKL
ncbi:MAG: hypothetical protein AABX54_04145 [Nanoarchaeota archaeon]